ncbi:hypothetical protein BC831DRAFT_454565 [Entophlyctis helioformis]|nr:hypothetical protein BC831DRAFT_454565 [Entophlyctis helioformis]
MADNEQPEPRPTKTVMFINALRFVAVLVGADPGDAPKSTRRRDRNIDDERKIMRWMAGCVMVNRLRLLVYTFFVGILPGIAIIVLGVYAFLATTNGSYAKPVYQAYWALLVIDAVRTSILFILMIAGVPTYLNDFCSGQSDSSSCQQAVLYGSIFGYALLLVFEISFVYNSKNYLIRVMEAEAEAAGPDAAATTQSDAEKGAAPASRFTFPKMTMPKAALPKAFKPKTSQ